MNKKFTITCEMPERWIPQFLGMLKTMQYLGRIGGSRFIKFYSDGDGDFRPKFNWDNGLKINWNKNIPHPVYPIWKKEEAFFDAG